MLDKFIVTIASRMEEAGVWDNKENDHNVTEMLDDEIGHMNKAAEQSPEKANIFDNELNEREALGEINVNQ
jgi:hypothetical protein